ncbi:unnamed protein product, partial [marine sediment metagenome]
EYNKAVVSSKYNESPRLSYNEVVVFSQIR